MATGKREHHATDDPSTSRDGILRAVEVRSERIGVVGRCDTVEVDREGRASVIEYKATPVRQRPDLTESMKVQVLLQASALRDIGFDVVGQAVYFTSHKVRKQVAGGEKDIEAAEDAVRATVALLESR